MTIQLSRLYMMKALALNELMLSEIFLYWLIFVILALPARIYLALSVRIYLRVNNKDTWATLTPVTSFWYLYCQFWTDFTHCSGVSIVVDFKQVNAGWVADCYIIVDSGGNLQIFCVERKT